MCWSGKIPHLNEGAVTAVPHDALDLALQALLEPAQQLLEVNSWRFSEHNAAMRHQAVNGLLLTPQFCSTTYMRVSHFTIVTGHLIHAKAYLQKWN